MAGRTEPSVSADEIDRELSGRFRALRFRPEVEALFLDDYVARRARMVPLWALLGTLLYDMAAVGDLTMLPEMASTLLFLRWGVFTAFAVMTVAIIKMWPTARNYEILSLCIGLLGIAIPMGAFVFSEGPYLFIYQTGSVCTLLYFVIVLRPRFHVVLLGLVAMCAIQFLTIRANGSFDDVTYTGIVTFYFTLCVFLAMASYFLEYGERQNFLHRVRGEKLHEQLLYRSEHDELTGLLNRRSLAGVAETLWRPGRRPRRVAAVLLDVDNFKLYNDVHGHVEGDEVLRTVSACVRGVAEGRGRVFRFGGEEMLVLLSGTASFHAHDVAEEIRRSIAALEISHHGLAEGSIVTASLGWAVCLTTEQSFGELVQKADAALYEAKHAGRNTVRPQADGKLELDIEVPPRVRMKAR